MSKKQQNLISKAQSANNHTNEGGTLLDIIINLKPSLNSYITPSNRTRSFAYLAKAKSGVTDKTVTITNKSDLNNYTDDTLVSAIFDNGISQITLALIENNPSFIDLSKDAYTLVVGEGIDITDSSIISDLNKFDGVKVCTVSAISENSDSLALMPNYCVVLSHPGEPTASTLFAKFLSATNFQNLQYIDFSGFTAQLTSKGDIVSARSKGYTFIAQDSVTIKNPVLMYFRAGGAAIADIYIAEALREDIQAALMNFIVKNKPRYLNDQIVNLMVVAKKVINYYIDNSLIQDASFNIPSKETQKESDVVVGKLSGIKSTTTLAGALWWLEGDVTYDLA